MDHLSVSGNVPLNPLSEATAVADLADTLYEFLPGSSAWGSYTFADAAREAGVAEYWQGGSKRPAIQQLLRSTLTRRRDRLCPLVETVVGHGIMRRRGNDPVRRDEVDRVNEALLKLEFKIPELWDEAFLASLPGSASPPPAPAAESPGAPAASGADRARRVQLADLKERFLMLSTLGDRQEAGRDLEVVLNRLFLLAGLDPREPFRVVGEQIDGSFDLDRDIYLMEAKWQKQPIGLGDLAALRVKVEGKSAWTRGLFISINGYSEVGLAALVSGKQQTCVLMDGADLFRVFNGDIDLADLLHRKVRWLAERGQPYVPMDTLMRC
jgi:Restriction endonuclease